MIEFKPLGGVRSHQADGVFIAGGEADRSASFAEIVQILEQFAEFAGLGDSFRLGLPNRDEVEHGGDWRGGRVELKATNDNLQSGLAVGGGLGNFVARTLQYFENGRASWNFFQHRCDSLVALVSGESSHSGSQLVGIDGKLRQRGDAE